MKRIYVITAGKKAKLLILSLVLILVGFIFASRINQQVVAVSTSSSVSSPAEGQKIISLISNSLPDEFYQYMLGRSSLVFRDFDEDQYKITSILSGTMEKIVGFNPTNPLHCLTAQIPSLKSVEEKSVETVVGSYKGMEDDGGEEDFYLDIPPELAEWDFELVTTPLNQLADEVLVLIYNTHNAECYKPSSGKSKQEGKNAGVSTAARTLEHVLEDTYQVNTIYSNIIHDYPSFSKSYIRSLETVQALLTKYDKAQVVLDIHRDAGFTDKKHTTTQISGEDVATITMVLGTEHENWKQNYDFAKKIEAKANKIYPGLIRDIRVREDRVYNQQVHPRSLIIEVGSDLNTQQEANLCMKYFAEVLVAVLEENINK